MFPERCINFSLHKFQYNILHDDTWKCKKKDEKYSHPRDYL